MVFDHMNTNKIKVKVNVYKYQQEDFKCDLMLINIFLTLINDFYS